MDFLRVVISIIMVILAPLSFFSSEPENNTSATYTDLEAPVKLERDYGEYTPGEYDITVAPESVYSTIEEAKEAVRKLRADGVNEHITVWIKEGTYVLSSPLNFDANDTNVTFRAVPGEEVTVTSCVPVTGWKNDTANGVAVWSAEVADDASFSVMIKNNEVLSQTRYPETGYFRVPEENHTGSLFTEENTPWEYTYGDMQFTRDSADTRAEFHNIGDVTVRMLHYWVGEISYLDSYNAETNRYSITKPLSMEVREGDRYYFENVFEALDSPGEWYLDKKENKVYYVPCEGESIDDTVLYAATLNNLIMMNGSENISFEGIRFSGTDWEYPTEFQGYWFTQYEIRHPQGEVDVSGTLEIQNSSNINIINCDFVNLGQTAVRFKSNVKNSVVSGCYFNNIGGSGVFINGVDTEDESIMTENITVTDNRIDGYGKNFCGAIGVMITHARNCEISHNEISDGRYTAISVGWIWGYAYNVTDNIKICDNLIYNIGQGWLSDMGGIYTLGVQPNSVISGNVIHDVAADEGQGGYGGWGIYLDEGSSYMLVEKNLVYNCGSQGFHQHYGEENTVRNNIFAFNKVAQLKLSRAEEHNAFNLTGNIIVGDNQLMYGNINVDNFTDDGNIYWDYTRGEYMLSSIKEDFDFGDRIYKPAMELMGFYNNGVFADPLFRDAENLDFTLPDNSEVTDSIGFEKWNYLNAGTITEFNK